MEIQLQKKNDPKVSHYSALRRKRKLQRIGKVPKSEGGIGVKKKGLIGGVFNSMGDGKTGKEKGFGFWIG